MAWRLLPDLFQQTMTVNGVPAVGYVLKAYLYNTTTPAALATDSAGSGQATSFTLNSRGAPQSAGGTEVSLFGNDAVTGGYKIVLEDASSSVVRTYAGPILISAIAGDIGAITAADIPVTPPGGNATNVSAYINLIRELYVENFGDVAFDGSTDDSATWQAAVNHITANYTRRTVLTSRNTGATALATPLELKSYVDLDCRCTFKGSFASPTNRIIYTSASVRQYDIRMANFKVDRSVINSQHGILTGGITGLIIDGIEIDGYNALNATSGALGISPFDEYADLISYDVQVKNVVIRKANNFGIAFGNVASGFIQSPRFYDCFREVIGVEGYDATGGTPPDYGDSEIIVSDVIAYINDTYQNGGTPSPAIQIGGATSNGKVLNCIIDNPIVVVQGAMAAAQTYAGISVVGGANLYVEKVKIVNPVISGATGQGIAIGSLGSLGRYVEVINPTIIDCNSGANTSPSGSAIGLRNVSGCVIKSPVVRGSNHTHMVEETGGSNSNVILDPIGDTGTTTDVTLTGAASVVRRIGLLASVGVTTSKINVQEVTLADDATHTFAACGLSNRALYFLTSNYNDLTQCGFSVNSTSAPTILFEPASGSLIASGATNPDTDGLVNIWPASSTTISIKNRLGSSRTFVLTSIANV